MLLLRPPLLRRAFRRAGPPALHFTVTKRGRFAHQLLPLRQAFHRSPYVSPLSLRLARLRVRAGLCRLQRQRTDVRTRRAREVQLSVQGGLQHSAKNI